MQAKAQTQHGKKMRQDNEMLNDNNFIDNNWSKIPEGVGNLLSTKLPIFHNQTQLYLHYNP